MLELRSKRGHWQAFLDGTSRYSDWEFGKVFEREGLLFIESNGWDFRTLDCIELTSGRPLWRFVFRVKPVLTSTLRGIGLDLPRSYLIQECYQQRSLFRDLEKRPLPAVAIVSDPDLMEREGSFRPMQQADLLVTAPEPWTFEPFIENFARLAVLWTALVWGLVMLGGISMICLLKKRFALPDSTRRVWLTLGLFVYLAAILVVCGRIDFYAAATAKILLVAVFMQAAFYALRVQSRRSRRLVFQFSLYSGKSSRSVR
jgi:hypothetical protein